jgi:hypothetical protein
MKKVILPILGLPLLISGCGSPPESHIGDKIACSLGGMSGVFVDYYEEYENQDWSGEKDTKYNITINHKVTMTYPAIFNGPYGEVITMVGRENKEDITGTFEKTAIVPYTKSGSKFIPEFSQHWSIIELKEAPDITKVIIAAELNSETELLVQNSECTIETIAEKK